MYVKQKIMDGEIDPTKTEDKTTETSGGARGGGDDDPRDLRVPDSPTQTSDDPRRKWWERGGARPKDPYAYQKLPMSELPKEKSRLSPPKGGPKIKETSFIEGTPSGRVLNSDSLRIQITNETLKTDYPLYGKDGKLLTLEVKEGKALVVGPQVGRYPLFKADGNQLTQSYQDQL